MTRLQSALILLLLLRAFAELKLPTFVSDHMVLQRAPHKSRLWGWAKPGSNITADIDGKGVVAFAIASTSSDGKWAMELPPQATGVSHKVVLSEDGADDSVITLNDIAFGDVFLCSGQSNMVMSLKAAFNGTAEAADSTNFPHLRFASVNRWVTDEPQHDVESLAPHAWARSSPDAISPDPHFKGWPSATCYYFGREIYKELSGQVPIGLVISCWGARKIESFSSPDALADDTCGGTRPPNKGAAYDPQDATSDMDAAFIYNPFYSPEAQKPQASQLWNAMIHPFVQMRFAGVVWYQGEADSGDPEGYSCRFPAMIADWRLKMDLPDMPFYYVQLAANSDSDYTLFRSAQGAALQLPKVLVANAIDVGDPTSPYRPLHPRWKQEVGRRLAMNALAFQYHQSDVTHKGPTVSTVQLTNTGVLIGFEPSTARGLHFEGTAACDDCCYEPPFVVLGTLGNWTRATPTIQDDGITVHVASSEQILGIRFDWEAFPQCALYNVHGGPGDPHGIPALPFEWCAYPTGKPTWSGQACGLVDRDFFDLD